MRRALLLLLLLAIIGGAAARLAFWFYLESEGPPLSAPVRIDVAIGEPFRATARKLQTAGLARSALALTLWARWTHVDRQIQHGAYQFTASGTPIALVEKMRTGEAMVMRVTLPEGGTARELAAALEHAGLGEAAKFLALAHDPAFAAKLGIAGSGLEGYLFPDTYTFSPLDSPEKILTAFVVQFRKVFTPDMTADTERQGLTVHQIVTLASVIEKETGRDEERPLVSAVFRNRLRLGMPLQADPTVIYGNTEFNGNLTKKDLETPTAYNTYTATGLPPGPISNPGRLSLAAALHPADAPFLYFVARDDGTHVFNTSLEEHNRAVNRYQRSRHARAAAG